MKKNRGSTLLITPIIWTITIFIFVFFIVASVRIMEPFVIYQKMSETALKYIFVIEEFGKLNDLEEKALKNELIRKGLDANNIIIDATKNEKNYGEVVELNIKYIFPYKKTNFKKYLMPEYTLENIDICISKKGVSKR